MNIEKLAYLQTQQNNLITQLAKVHNTKEDILSVALIGSIAKSLSRKDSDIDLLILTRKLMDENRAYEITRNISSDLIPCISDDIYVLAGTSPRVSLAYRLIDAFTASINDLFNGQNIESNTLSWSVGGSMPEVLLSDLSACIVLFDKSGFLSNTKKKLQASYPEQLRSHLMIKMNKEIQCKLIMMKMYAKDNAMVLLNICICELVVAVIRYVLAKHRIFNPGIKHLLHPSYRSKEIYYEQLPELRPLLNLMAKNDLSEKKEQIIRIVNSALISI
jgi:predicted nucleotidyltransferase